MSLVKIAALRSTTIKAAKAIPDYNFRSYFVQHTKDRYSAFDASKASAEEVAAFAKKSEELLGQMRRMALMSALYAEQNVVLDPRAKKSSSETPVAE
jgi:hypothetical protein